MAGLRLLERTRQACEHHVQPHCGLPVATISDCMTRIDATLRRIGDELEPQ